MFLNYKDGRGITKTNEISERIVTFYRVIQNTRWEKHKQSEGTVK